VNFGLLNYKSPLLSVYGAVIGYTNEYIYEGLANEFG
jgi:hypothetical protein